MRVSHNKTACKIDYLKFGCLLNLCCIGHSWLLCYKIKLFLFLSVIHGNCYTKHAVQLGVPSS